MTATVQTKEKIFSLIQQQQSALKALGVKRLGLFGSFVRGEPKPDSDVDVLVEFEPGQKNFDHFIQLVFLLEEIFARRVEVLTPEALSPYLRPYIMQEVEDVPFGA